MKVRIDKFAWSIRLAKTRSIATEEVNKKKILLNGDAVKPSKEVKIGDIVSVVKNNATFSFKVKELLNNRVGAKLVEQYIIDVTPEEEKEKYNTYKVAQKAYRHYGTGRPTRQDRKKIEAFLGFQNGEK